ncbi:TIGR02611 family protein [Mycobacterium sp. CVI_P3]|uniref:TIGR02611 family protein n=1 Tax=Mycobacterium pinniadriaticum TaxID=2994102 RepID=A0ABT3SIF4_9MYCO|nr:TIGR02611 family protein [Mycobacterium pinniadriaticum]MCX2932879.1 TIGR02611 family protein [Mycobacterium pinniadriaticum]MCX2939302.1 TIGR02611 family protein [Mycobacterium pinniadriaticum]
MKRRLRQWARLRDRLRERPVADFGYRVVVGVVGLAVLLVGIVAIPYPGPGWAIVFLGLAILATEFYWAHRALTFTRGRYDGAMVWFRRQGWWVQALGAVFTAAVVVTTLWLVGAVGWSAGLLGLDHPALDSPIGLGA